MDYPISQGRWVIIASLTFALLLTVAPLPGLEEELRPQWVALTLIYWTLALPERVGVFWAWITGVILDATTETVLGQHALSLSVMAWLALELHRRIRLFPPMQQALSIWVLLLVERLLSLWVMGATGIPTPSLVYWVPTVIGMALWPLIFRILRALRRYFHVT